MACARAPNIDDIDDMMELSDIMREFGIPGKGLKTLEQMKTKVKEHLRKLPKDTTKKAFHFVSKAKDEDIRKREHLYKLFSLTKTCLDRMDNAVLSGLNKNFGDVKNAITKYQNRLRQQQYYVLVAGESSGGKSSFLNVLLGEQLLPTALLSSTSTICELKYGLERRLVIHFKDVDPETNLPTKTIQLQSGNTSYIDQISSYVYMKTEREKGSPYKKVEIFWPHELLQNGITVIDSPGVGECQIMDEIVQSYLPNAFAFIYIINTTSAGGIKKDRIGKLLSGVKKISTERNEEFPSKCALFICNKWDTVAEKESREVKEHVTKQLTRCWPELDSESQIVYLSTTRAAKAQAHGVMAPDFQDFVTKLNAMMLTAIDTRLESQWKWLRYLLSRMIYQTKAFIHNADRGRKEVAEQMKAITYQIKKIEDEQDVTAAQLRWRLEEQQKNAVLELVEHLKLTEIQKKFSNWSDSGSQITEPTKSWNAARHEILKLFESRLKSYVEDWEEKTHVFAETMKSLKKIIVMKWQLVESQLQQLENNIVEDKNPAVDIPISFDDHNFSTREKVLIGVTSPIWVPITVAVGALAIPVLGIMAITDKITDANTLRKYKNDQPAFLAKASLKYLAEMASEKGMLPFAAPQFDEARQYLHYMRARLPEIIEADRKLILQLEKETRTKQEIQAFYTPINQKCSEIRGELDLFGLSEIRRMDIDHSNLEWESRLAEGGFGIVYSGKWRKREGTIDVAIKVSHEPLSSWTASSFLEEEKILRKLNHAHIVKFYGTALKRNGSKANMVLVMELCQGSLRDLITKDPAKIPGKSARPADVKRTVQWAVEITNGLDYMHNLRIVHRDLKLDNILVTKSEVIKIADVGLAKKANEIIGTVAGTCLYMAPEVWASKKYDSAADMYSFGITMWEMWYGGIAFRDYPQLPRQELEKHVLKGLRPTHVPTCTKPRNRWQQVMTSCWAADSKQRLSAAKCQNILKSLLKDCTAQLP